MEKRITLESNKLHPTQLKVFLSMILLYTFYFVVNYNLGPSSMSIQKELNITSSEFGIIFTVFTLTFALGQFFSGFLSDRYSAKKIMLIGAFGAIVANLCFSLSNSLLLFTIFWGINGLFLSLGWSPGCSILFNWFPKSRLGLFMGIYNAFSFLGGVIVYPLVGYIIPTFGWRAVFVIPPIILFLWSFEFISIVKDTPNQAGFNIDWAENNKITSVGIKDYLIVLTHPLMNLVYLATICSQFVRWGLVNWVLKILTASVDLGGYGMDLGLATTIAACMHMGGMVFSIAFGYISDKVFNGTRWQTVLLGFSLSASALLILFIIGSSVNLILLSILLFISGGCIQGLQAPLFNLPGDILGSKLGATGVGIACGWSYIGASLSGVTLGWFLDNYGFLNGFLLMALISLLGGFISSNIKK